MTSLIITSTLVTTIITTASVVVIPIIATTTATIVTASIVPTTIPSAPAIAAATTTLTTALTRHVLHRQDGLVQLTTVGAFLGLGGVFDGMKLHKGVVAFHVDAYQRSVGTKEHFQVFAFGRFFVKVDHKECFGRSNVLAAFVFLALDAAVAAGEFGADFIGDTGNFAVCVCVCNKRSEKKWVKLFL